MNDIQSSVNIPIEPFRLSPYSTLYCYLNLSYNVITNQINGLLLAGSLLEREAGFLGCPLSKYARSPVHTFATIAKYKGAPVAAISEAVRHTDIKATQVYLSQFDQDTLDGFHEMVVGG